MDQPETPLFKAKRRVERGREIVAAQRGRIERLRAIGGSTDAAETILAQFLNVQAALEAAQLSLWASAEIPREYRPF